MSEPQKTSWFNISDEHCLKIELLKVYIPEKMRTKNWFFFILFVLSMLVMLWLVSNPTPDLHKIVTATHRTLHKLKVAHVRDHGYKELTVDSSYLDYLGFSDNPQQFGSLYESIPQNRPVGKHENMLVIGSAVWWQTNYYAKDLIKNVHRFHPSLEMVFFDIGLSKYDHMQLLTICNDTVNCRVKKFMYEKFPYHIQNTDIKSYKPLAIQILLNIYGAVIWIDLNPNNEYFITANINPVLKQAQKVGIAAWTVDEPTSALTHPKTFKYFKSNREDYFFHRMVATDRLVIYNTDTVHKNVMLPWVQCALVEECIRPHGAQNTVCNTLRKPLFRYSGCHHYEMSALNVILGLKFDYDCHEYSSSLSIFGKLMDNQTSTKPPFNA